MVVRLWAVMLLALFLSMPARAQSSRAVSTDETIKIDTLLVNLPVVVSDKEGRYIPNLAMSDFTLYDSGVKQEIAFFAPEAAPLQLLLLIDVSAKAAPNLRAMQRAATDLVHNLRPEDKAAVITFADDITALNQDFTSNKEEVVAAIGKIKAGGRNRLYDALTFYTGSVLKQLKGRKALALFTAGGDTFSSLSADAAIAAASECGALTYVLHFEPSEAAFNNLPSESARSVPGPKG